MTKDEMKALIRTVINERRSMPTTKLVAEVKKRIPAGEEAPDIDLCIDELVNEGKLINMPSPMEQFQREDK